jgi:hypothetical protein
MKLDDVTIEMSILPDYEESGESVRQIGRSKFEVSVDEFLTMKTKVHNRSESFIDPLLRLQPSLSNLPHNTALDLDKRLSWTGVLQRKLPLLAPGQTVESELGIVALCSGIFEVGATLEEIRLWNKEKEGQDGSRARSDTNFLQGHLLGNVGLRTWHAKESCWIVAKRRGMD